MTLGMKTIGNDGWERQELKVQSNHEDSFKWKILFPPNVQPSLLNMHILNQWFA